MELRCPECLSPLRVGGDGMAMCPGHGGRYQVLFARQAVPSEPRPASASTDGPGASPAGWCRNHQHRPAEHVCRDCGAEICATCAFVDAAGVAQCHYCFAKANPPSPTGQAVAIGEHCPRHPRQTIVRVCHTCQVGMCKTCDFAMPGGVHLCPECVAKPQTGLSSKRKTMLIWSYVLAVWTTIAFFGFMVAAVLAQVIGEDVFMLISQVAGYLVLLPAIGGFATSLGCLDRRLSNSAAIWLSIVWNSLLLGAFLLLIVVGLFVD